MRKDEEIDEKIIMHIKNYSSVLASKTNVIKDINIKNIISEKNENTILSKREIMVLKAMAMGYTNAEISQELNIAVGTVKNHISNILSKLETDSRIKAVTIAKKKNII